jgi:hypothetical protein
MSSSSSRPLTNEVLLPFTKSPFLPIDTCIPPSSNCKVPSGRLGQFVQEEPKIVYLPVNWRLGRDANTHFAHALLEACHGPLPSFETPFQRFCQALTKTLPNCRQAQPDCSRWPRSGFGTFKYLFMRYKKKML